jgi:hypothetical protein
VPGERPNGTVAVRLVADTQTTSRSLVEPRETIGVAPKSVPVIVMAALISFGSVFGVTPVTVRLVGAASAAFGTVEPPVDMGKEASSKTRKMPIRITRSGR